MNASKVELKKVYDCKVGRNTVQVRIDRSSPKGGWDGTVVSTGKKIAIRDAKRLLRLSAPPKVKGPKCGHSKCIDNYMTTGKTACIVKGKKKLSALDAAAKVLAKVKGGMNCGDMIETMQKSGLWKSPGGKTPANTLYSAILSEIKVKGGDARFKKVGRGEFAAAG